MILTWKPLQKMPDPQQVKALYTTAFPKEEQLPWPVVRLLAALGRLQVDCYLADDVFCGFTVSAATEQVLFVLFFAVTEEMRGNGCGSAILQLRRAEDLQREIVLNVEHLDPMAENAAQRVQRMRFYNRNGLFDTGYDIDEVGGTFRVLSTAKLDVPAYRKVFRKISLGLWRPAMRKVAEHDPNLNA